MNIIRKKVICLTLAIALSFSLLPASVFASDIVASGYCGGEGDGTNLTWTLDSDGLLTISGTGKMADYSWTDDNDSPWSWYSSDIINIIIGPKVTTIGDFAFWDYRNVISVSLSSGLTKIGDYAFYNTSLLEIFIPQSVEFIGDSAFRECNSLDDISVDVDNPIFRIDDDVLVSKEAVIFCPRKKDGNYSVPEGITVIKNAAFKDCENLDSITLPNSVVTIEDEAFEWCSSLTNMVIPESVTEIGDMAFWSCHHLTSIIIQGGVTRIEDDTFNACHDLVDVVLPDSITEIGSNAFELCESLESIVIPQNVLEIGEDAFFSCRSLKSVTMPDSMLSIGPGAFEFCSSLKSIRIPVGITRIGGSTFHWCSSITDISIPDSVVSVESYAFSLCDKLADVYYDGTEKQWNSISIESYNDPLLNATIHYNGIDNYEEPDEPVDVEYKDYSNIKITYASEASKKDLQYEGIRFNDIWLFGDSTKYNHELAIASLAMAMTGFASKTCPCGHDCKCDKDCKCENCDCNSGCTADRDKNIKDFYSKLDFDVSSKNYFCYGYDKEDSDSVALTLATKQIGEDTIMAITLRGAGYSDGGWAGNFEVSKNSAKKVIVHNGFASGASYAETVIKNSIKELQSAGKPVDPEHLHIWLTGYSRSAAVANLLAARLMNHGICNQKNLYAYTFATPNTITANQFKNSYPNIINIVNPIDIVPWVPLPQWSFGKLGVNYEIPVAGRENNKEKQFLNRFTELTGLTYHYGKNQQASIDYLTIILNDAIPFERYSEKYQEILVRWKKDKLSEDFLNQFLFANKFTLSEYKELINKIQEIDEDAQEKDKIAKKLVYLHKLIRRIESAIPTVVIENKEVAKILVEMLDVAVLAANEQRKNADPAINSNMLNVFRDLIDRATEKNKPVFQSDLLLQHWPEVYLSWLLVSEPYQIHKTNLFTVATVSCPVDVEVYDQSGILVGRTIPETYSFIDDENVEHVYSFSVIDESVTTLEASVIGENKIFILPDDQCYSFRIISNESFSDGDTMTVTVSNYENCQEMSKVSYENISLSKATEIEAVIQAGTVCNAETVSLTDTIVGTIDPTSVIDNTISNVFYQAEALLFEGVYTIAGKLAPQSKDTTIYCAAYDENGRYIAGTSITVVSSTEVKDITLSLDVGIEEAETVDTIKLFLLDKNKYVPITTNLDQLWID